MASRRPLVIVAGRPQQLPAGDSVEGTLASANSSKSAAYTIATTDAGKIIECDTTAGAFTVTLPAASTAAGMVFTVRKTDTTSNIVTIACNGSDTIQTTSSASLWDAGDLITLSSTGVGAWVVLGSTLRAAATTAAFLPLGSPEGLTLSRNSGSPSSSIDIASGRVLIASATGLRYRISLGSILTRSLTSLFGSGNGGRFSGTVSANQWWHVFAMRNDTTGLGDFGFDTSATGANKPSGWSVRMIGSIKTDGSSNIIDFVQTNDTFYWKTEIEDFRGAIGTTATLYTLSVPPINGIEAIVRIAGGLPSTGNANAILISSPLVNDAAPGRLGGAASVESVLTASLEYTQSAVDRILTNTGQVRGRAIFGAYNNNPRLATIGFVHPRGAS